MLISSIMGRELRVASRRSVTWWRRVGIFGLAMVVIAVAYYWNSFWGASGRMGGELFVWIAWLMFGYAVLTGPLTTVDCLSREQREGTLGLLFLTPLRSADVVLGKVGAASFDHVLGFFSLLPLMTIPFLLGGVSVPLVCWASLGALNVMLFSLAAGACVSAFCSSTRASLGLTVVFLLLMCAGVPFFWSVMGCDSWRMQGVMMNPEWLLLPCPLLCALILESPFLGLAPPPLVTTNMLVTAMMTFALVRVAIWRTAHAWKEEDPAGFASRVRRPVRLMNRPMPKWAKGYRSIRAKNPIAWLELRERLQDWTLATMLVVNFATWLAVWWVSPPSSTWSSFDAEVVVVWLLVAQYILCVWMAVQAPRRLFEDRQSGALELLLCTKLSAREYLGGIMRAWRVRFGVIVLGLMFLHLLMLGACLEEGWASVPHQDMLELGGLALAVFPLQAYTIQRLGLYYALVSRNLIAASVTIILMMCLLPWVLFFGTMIFLETVLNPRLFGGLSDTVAMTIWTLAHVGPMLGFLASANWRLRHLREMVTELHVPFWKRRGRTGRDR